MSNKRSIFGQEMGYEPDTLDQVAAAVAATPLPSDVLVCRPGVDDEHELDDHEHLDDDGPEWGA